MTSNAGPIFGPKGMETVMVLISLLIPADPLDPESIPLEFDTWTIGESEKKALARWRRENPAMAEHASKSRVLTPNPSAQHGPDAAPKNRFGRLKYG